MKCEIINQSGLRIPRQFLLQWVHAVAKELKKRHISLKADELTLVFLTNQKGRALNKQFRQKSYATDILSFSDLDSESLGELVICPAVIKRQAKEHGLTSKQEFGYVVLHGILHLLGFEHENNSKDAQKMFHLQDQIFAQLLDRFEKKTP